MKSIQPLKRIKNPSRIEKSKSPEERAFRIAPVTLRYQYLKKQTFKAWLIRFANYPKKEAWLAKKICVIHPSEHCVTVPRWLAEKYHIISFLDSGPS